MMNEKGQAGDLSMKYFSLMFSEAVVCRYALVGLVRIDHINYSSVSGQLQIYSWLGETSPAGASWWSAYS